MNSKDATDPSVFDFPRFEKLYRLNDIPKEYWRETVIVRPENIVYVEQLRNLAASSQDLGPTIPCDIFIFGKGEPPNPEFTKIGGRPYRPARLSWPKNDSNEPMTFLAQFNFSGSRDLFPSLPADILLIFAEDDDINSDDRQSEIAFEWHPISPNIELIAPEDVPKTNWEIGACYGLRHRTYDFASPDVPMKLSKHLLPELVEKLTIHGITAGIDRLLGTKIGGLPYSARPEKLPSRWQGPLLCSIATISEAYDTPFPWVNQEAPNPFPYSGDLKPLLDILAGFTMEFYLEPSGDMKWWIQFLP